MKKGDIVKFKEGLYADEEGSFYRILAVNGDRAIIEFICDLPLPPNSVAMVQDLEVVEPG